MSLSIPVLVLHSSPEPKIQIHHNNKESTYTLNNEVLKISTHGSGWCHNNILSTSTKLENLVAKLNPFDIPNSLGSNLKGSICCYVRYKKSIYILPDPLGSAIVFKYHKNGISAFSSDLHALIQVLNSLEIYPKKNINYLIELISTGNGGFNSSSYEDIEAIDNFSYIRINNNKYQINKYANYEDFFTPSNPELLFEETRHDILTNVTTALESNFDIISHLTGGFDSRLILSALSCSSNFKNKCLFFCSGNNELLDKKIALQISGHLNLKMADSDGTYSSFSRLPSFEESQGLLKITLPDHARPNNLIISGGYGECLRSFYKDRYKLEKNYNIYDILNALYGSLCFGDDPKSRLISTEFHNDYAKKLDNFIKDSLNKGLRYDAIFDYMYLAIRNRYYVGLTSLYHSNLSPRVDPLYTLSGSKLALNTELNKRQNNFIGLNLMKSFNEVILGLPFDYDRIGEKYELEYGKVKRITPTPGNIEIVKLINKYKKQSDNVSGDSKKLQKEDLEKAKKLNAPLWQVIHLKEAQKELAISLDNLGKDKISEVMNYQAINRLATRELNNRVHIRYVHSINEALKWYFN